MRNHESAEIAQALQLQQAQTHLNNLPWAVFGSFATALGLVAMQWGAVPGAALLGWLAGVAAALAARLVTGALQRRSAAGATPQRTWLWRHRVGYLVHGTAWGLAAFLPIPGGDTAHQAVMMILLVAMASGSFALTAFDHVAALGFGVPVLGLLSMHLFTQDEAFYRHLGVACVAGLIFMSLTVRRAHRFVRSYLASRLAEAAQADALRSSEELLERTGATAGVGGWEFDVASAALRLTAQAYRIHGFDPASAPGLDALVDCYAAPRRQALREALDAAGASGRAFDLELPLNAAGQARWVRLIGQPLLDAGRVQRVSGVVQDITAKKTAEIALAEKHHLLSLLVRTTSEGFWFVDTDAITTDANPAMCRILGRSHDEVMGKSIFDFVDAANAAIFQREIQHRAAGQAGSYEIALQRPDGSLVDCLNHATPIFDTQGQRVGSIGMWTDISARNRAEQQLRAAGEQLSQKSQALQVTLDSMAQGIVTLDAAGRPLVHNRRVLELLDLPEALLAAPSTYDDVVRFQIARGELAADASFIDATGARRHFPGGRTNSPEVYVRRAHSGALVEVRTRQLPGGGLVRTYADVTAYVEAQRALRDSEAQLRALLDAFPGFIAAVDAQFRYAYVNARMAGLWGLASDALIGRSAHDVLGADAFAQLQHELGRLRPDHQVTVEREYAPLGERPHTWLQVTHALGSDDDAGGHKYYAFGIDISARKLAEQELIVARDEAQRANRAKSQFLSSMSHELRTPMNAILGFAQLLVSDPKQPLGERQASHVHEILHGARHLLSLINEVLDLALVETGKLQVSMEPVAVGELLRDCLGLLDPLARGAGIEMTLVESDVEADADADTDTGRGRGDESYVLADRTRLKQVVLNLLSNAIKYNRPGGQVHIRRAAEAGRLKLAVADTGPGLDARQRERLFEAFERLDASGTSVEGAGLGLALSKRLMAAMGGEIGVASEPGRGSTFWISLPCAARPLPAEWPEPCEARERSHGGAAANPPGAPAANASGAPRARGRGARTVLYIEDNPVNLLLMDAMLARIDGVHLITAALPEQGLQLAARERPDLILLDIQLPGMDGFEVLRRLRLDPASAAIPVIAVSANAMPADIEHGLAAGFAEYLTKPLDVQQLLAAVEGAFVES